MTTQNELFIQNAKVARSGARKMRIANAIAVLDEEIAMSAAKHEITEGRRMEHRQRMLAAMDQELPDHEIDRMVSEFENR